MRNYIEHQKSLRFIFPIDGDCLNEYDGQIKDGKLCVKIRLFSSCDVTVNGQKAEKSGQEYVREVCLDVGKNIIKAENGKDTEEICVYRLQKAIGFYRLSSDDNIIFLWDINKNKDKYRSIFDNQYLALYKKAHDLYGASVHLNIYYEMPKVHPKFSKEREYFDLSMMTDKFKKEWQENSDWLKLNFHAKADKPDNPYIDADYSTVYEDCKKVQDEIIRFAGEECLSSETTLHWGKCTPEGVKAMRKLGIKNLAGYFVIVNGRPSVAYFYPKYLVEYLSRRDFWYDKDCDVLYCKTDRVLNLHTAKEAIELLNILYDHQNGNKGFIELMIHEQYYYDDYASHLYDFEERVLEGCRWAAEKGYKGAFIDEIRL